MLLTGEQTTDTETQIVRSVAGSIDVLRGILATQQKCEIGQDEAREVGASLIEFYEILAEEVSDESES